VLVKTNPNERRKKMPVNIEDLTVKEVREIAALVNGVSGGQPCEISPWSIGKNYLIRTVTMILTGCLVQVTKQELVLTSAAWIAETDRFADTVREGKFKEVEPYPDGWCVIVGRGSIIDAVAVSWPLPRIQK
jgi:hypothetical protein